jgi:hypothetical protein
MDLTIRQYEDLFKLAFMYITDGKKALEQMNLEKGQFADMVDSHRTVAEAGTAEQAEKTGSQVLLVGTYLDIKAQRAVSDLIEGFTLYHKALFVAKADIQDHPDMAGALEPMVEQAEHDFNELRQGIDMIVQAYDQKPGRA